MSTYNRQQNLVETSTKLQQQQQQYQNSQELNLFNTGALYGPLGPPQPVWKHFQDLEFYRENKISWRLGIYTIDDRPFACISHWFWSNLGAKWCPSTRQINLSKATFLQLVERIDEVVNTIKKLPDPERREGSKIA